MDNAVELEIIRDYREGYTIEDLIKKYHVVYATATKVFRKYDVPYGKGTRNKLRINSFLQKKKDCFNDYQNGMSLNQCCKKYNVYERELKKFLAEAGIHVRSYQENKVKLCYDVDFFKKQNHDMAWVLGFLAADGCISKKDNEIKIKLSAKDREILEKINWRLGLNKRITDYTTRDGYDVVGIAWTCKQHKEDLASYGIIPQKTYKGVGLPTNLDQCYWIDYIRGYFDGDGSINLIKNANGRGRGNLRWQVCSSTKEIIAFIRDELERLGVPPVSIQTRKPKDEQSIPMYIISYSCTATRKIYEILYNESPMFLQRKKAHFEKILNEVDPNYKE